MTALAKDRNTRFKHHGRTLTLKLEANAVIYAGAIVAANADGRAVPASDTAALKVMGIADHAADNSGGADDAISVRVTKDCVAELETSGGSAVTQADTGLPVYILDDQTVVKAAGATNDVIAGTLDQLDEETGKPWVKIFDPSTTA
jgi:hypothetical protein